MRAARRTLWCGTALALCACAAGPIYAQATLPVVATSGDGGAIITRDTSAGTMTIDINGANRVVKYDSFKLGSPTSSSETLTFLNSGTAGAHSVLNRVTGGSGSAIYGSITAPSDIAVWLVDPQGVTFGPTGSFSGGGLVVSTATLNAANETSFLAGTLNALSGATAKPILFQTGAGTIAASGSIAVVGQQVTVDRTMTSTGGSVALVAATDVSFSDINSPLSFTVSRGTTLATGLSIGGNGVISGQSIRLAGGVNNIVAAALLQVDPGASITATASDGAIVLATGTTSDITVANGSRTPGISSSGALHADGTSADIQIVGAGQVDVAGTLSAGRDISLSSADATSGSVTAAGAITAGRDYTVSAHDIVLGAAASTVTQKAGGAIIIGTTGGDISGKGSLTLQSNTDGAGAEALTLDPVSGEIDFGTATSLIGGTAANRSDVILGGGPTITTGDITGRALFRSGNATDLTSPGDITLGAVTVDAALRIASTGGSIKTGDLVSNGAVRLDAAAAGGIAAGTIDAGGTADLLAKGDIRLASIESTGAITLAAQTGDISGAALSPSIDDGRPLTGFGRVDLTASDAGQTINVTASGGTAQLGVLTAGAGAGNLAANQITVSAKSVDLRGATATNGHIDLESATGPIHAGALSAGSDTAPADVIVNAPSGAVTIDGAVSATHDYRVSGSSVTLGSSTGSVTQSAAGLLSVAAANGDISGLAGLSLKSGGDTTVDATGATILRGDVSATGDYSVSGTDVTLGNSSGSTTQSADGLISITATDGDITGRAGLSLQSGSDITLGATGVTTVAGAVSATGDYSVTGTSVTLGNASSATTQSAGGPLTVTATGGDITGLADLSLQSDSDITLGATGNSTVGGNVSAAGDYDVTATSVTLGNATSAATQSAGGVVNIVATDADITGLANLQLQSGGDGSGTGTLTLDAAGIVNFAGSSAILSGLETGPSSARADVLIRSAPSLSLGDVTALSLRTIDDPTDLAAAGSIVTGAIKVDQALAIHTTSGTITTGDVTVQDSGATLQLNAAGASSDLNTGDLHTNGAHILLSAGRDVVIGAASTAPGGTTPATGTIAILAGRDIDASALAAGEDIALSGSGALTIGAANAGDDIDIATSGAVSLVSAISTGGGADTRAVQFDRSIAGQSTAITFAGADGQLGSNIAISAASLGSAIPLVGDSDDGLVIGSLTGGTQTLTADQGDLRIGSLDANGAIDILASQGSVSGLRAGWIATSGGSTIKTPGKVVLNGVGTADFAIGSISAATIATGPTAPDTLRLGTVDAGSIDLTADTTLQIDNARITDTATLHTTGGTAQAFKLTDAALVSGYGSAQLKAADAAHDADISVLAPGAAQLGSLQADRNITVTAAAIDAATADTETADALSGSLFLKATSGRLTLGDASAATTATLIKEDTDIIGLAKTAADDVLTTGAVTAGGAASFRSETSAAIGAASASSGDLTINARDDATIGTGTASSGAIRILAGGNAAATILTASIEDIAVRAGGNADLGTLVAGDNLDLAAGGTLTITAGNSLGAGTDDRSFLFNMNQAGQDGAIAIDAMPAIDGDVGITGASVSLGTLSSVLGNVAITATNGNVSRLSDDPDSGSIATNDARSTISVSATGGTVQLGALSAGRGNLILTGAQIDLTARAIDIQSATATNGALAMTATDGDLKLGSGAAGTSATLIKQGQTGSLALDGALTAATDIGIQSQTDARLGSLKSTGGSVAVLAQSSVTGGDASGAGVNLDAFEDVAISAGGAVRIGTARAGDDITIETPGSVYLESAITDGSAHSDARTIQFDRSQIGQPGAIDFAGTSAMASSSPAGSNITIRAASLDGPTLTGDTDTGLVTGTIDSGAVNLSSAGGDIRADTIEAADGDIALTAGGSVTGRRTGFQSASGGATISAQGQVTFDISGTVSAGTVTAGTTVTNTGQATPESIRLGSVSAGTVALAAKTNLQVDSATVGGTTTLAVTSGTANASVEGYGPSTITAQAAGHSIAVDAGGTAQLGVIEAGQGQTGTAGDQIVVRGDTVRIGGMHAHNGDILVEAKSVLALLGAVDTANPDGTIVFRNTGTGGTLIGGTNADTGTDIALDQAELDLISGGNVVIDSVAQPVTIDKLTIASGTGTNSLRFLTTGTIDINDVIAGDGSGIVQIGGGSGADPDGLVDEAALASQIRANIGAVGTRAAILLPNGTVDLRAGRIVFATPTLVDKFLPQDGAPPGDKAVASEVADASSALYTSDDSSRQFLTARLLKVSYAHFALFQNTAAASGGGVALNETLPPSTGSLALQLFSTGERTDNSFLLFGSINGFVGRAAGILPNSSLEIRSGGVTRIAQGNARVNGCVIGSPDRGCLVTDSAPPNFAIYDQRQTQIFGFADDPLLFFNPLVGRGNEGLIVDIADAPVGIDTIECDPSKGPCATSGPK